MLLDTAKWPETHLDVLKDIQLDPKNVRLEIADAKVEADIIEDLFVNEDALSLVDGICKIGYLTHETPVVVKRRGKYVMVEGNRRLAALKAIQNPMLIPEFQARVGALAALLPDRSQLSKIRVMIAPSQSEADQLIAAIHTGNLRRPWTPGRQAAFFQAQIDSGRRYEDLIVRYPTIDVRKFVFRAHIINLFRSVDYDEQELREFIKTKRWAKGLSTLARIYESKPFLSLTGLAMDADGVMSKSISDETFAEMADAIVRGMFEENINTRSLNSLNSPRYQQLMTELSHIARGDGLPGIALAPAGADLSAAISPAPPRDLSDQSTLAPDVGDVQAGAVAHEMPDVSISPSKEETSSSSAAAATVGMPRRKKQRNLDLGQVKAPEEYPAAVKELLAELSEIDVQKYPNATFLTMRAALEKSIKSFAEAKSIDIRGSGINSDGRVQLGHCLTWLLEHVKANGPKYLIQVVEGVRSGKLVTYTNSKDSLDALNHNHHFGVDPDQTIAMWGSIDSIMRYLMKP